MAALGETFVILRLPIFNGELSFPRFVRITRQLHARRKERKHVDETSNRVNFPNAERFTVSAVKM